MYRPCNQAKLDLVKNSGFTKWPPRLPRQAIFYPVTNEQYAKEINQWNLPQFGKGYVTKFRVRKRFVGRYEIKKMGGKNHTEWWIPAEELEALNNNIVGLIEIVGEK